MAKKTAGKVNQPPTLAEFKKIGLDALCIALSGEFYRLHATDPSGKPWPPVHFSKRANSRFDPKGGVGTLCVAETLPGALMELFDDHWGPVSSIGRSVTEHQLQHTWVTRISLPNLKLFDATGSNLSKIGTDAQLLSGKYTTTRKWTKRLMDHPAEVDGILYRSRHDPSRLNIALFQRNAFLPAIKDASLLPYEPDPWTRSSTNSSIVYGDAITLSNHRDLMSALRDLQVARLP